MLETWSDLINIWQYIMQKVEIYELRETIKAMERKVEIAKGDKNNIQRSVSSRQSSATEVCRPARWTPGML